MAFQAIINALRDVGIFVKGDFQQNFTDEVLALNGDGADLTSINTSLTSQNARITAVETFATPTKIATSMESITDLLAAATNYLVTVRRYHAGGDLINAAYVYDASVSRTLHNGGTIIDPTKTFPSDWTNQSQQAAWYSAGTGSGCWTLQATGPMDGRVFGVTTDGTTDNTQALIEAAGACGTVMLPGGTYKISYIPLKSNYKFLSGGAAPIRFISAGVANRGVFDIDDSCGNVSNVEFHGIVENLATTAGLGVALQIYKTSNIVENLDFSGSQFITQAGSDQNAAGIVATSTAVAFYPWIRRLDFSHCKFKSNRMGMEILNHALNLTLTNVSIGTNAVFTSSDTINVKMKEGMLINMLGIVGTGPVSALNHQFMRVVNLTATTFQLAMQDGALYDTTGGTYTSGGTVRVYRCEDFIFDDCTFEALDLTTTQAIFGMGISISGYHAGHSLRRVRGLGLKSTLIELIGASKCNIEYPRGNCKLVSATNTSIMYDNTIVGLQSEGITGFAAVIRNQRRMTFRDFNLNSLNAIEFGTLQNCTIRDGSIKVSALIALWLTATDSSNPCTNNVFDNITLDVSDYTGTFDGNSAPLKFDGTYVYNNTARNITYIIGASQNGGKLGTGREIFQNGGATGNVLETWRYSGGPFVASPQRSRVNTALFRSSTSNCARYADLRYVTSSTMLTVTLTNPTSGGGQPHCIMIIECAGQNTNTPVGGTVKLHFGSSGSANAAIVTQAPAGFTVSAVQGPDGSGKYYWTVTPPTVTSISYYITAIIQDEYVNAYTLS